MPARVRVDEMTDRNFWIDHSPPRPCCQFAPVDYRSAGKSLIYDTPRRRKARPRLKSGLFGPPTVSELSPPSTGALIIAKVSDQTVYRKCAPATLRHFHSQVTSVT